MGKGTPTKSVKQKSSLRWPSSLPTNTDLISTLSRLAVYQVSTYRWIFQEHQARHAHMHNITENTGFIACNELPGNVPFLFEFCPHLQVVHCLVEVEAEVEEYNSSFCDFSCPLTVSTTKWPTQQSEATDLYYFFRQFFSFHIY